MREKDWMMEKEPCAKNYLITITAAELTSEPYARDQSNYC